MEPTSSSPNNSHLNEIQYSYPLKWLDLLITHQLNPAKTKLSLITAEHCKNICNQLLQEESRLELLVKSQVFAVNNEKKIELMIRRYYASLIVLLDQCLENQKVKSAGTQLLKGVHKSAQNCLGGLLSFIENQFTQYLGMDERVPATYLSVCKNELRSKVEKLEERLKKHIRLKPVTDIIIRRLNRFILATDLNYEITIRAILYKKECVRSLEELDWNNDETDPYTELDELLIYMNFNSKAYINYLRSSIKLKISACESDAQKLDRLLFYQKIFRQFHRKPGLVLNPKYHDLETVMGAWFDHEITYMERRINLSFVSLHEPEVVMTQKPKTEKVRQKVLCVLSSDQTGLILRAADELRILVAKSMNEVFRTIVPHLSTPYKEDLSYDGMRSKSYVAEERDKQKAIEALERMIKKIKDY